MDKINKSINNRINLEEGKNKISNDFNIITPTSYSNKTFNFKNHKKKLEKIDFNIGNINASLNNKYRKELIMAKIIISELQDKIEEINNEKKDLENKLNEALNTIKFLHSDFINLTDKFDKVNQTILIDSNNNEKKINEAENKINEIKAKNEQLKEELLTKEEINKLQEETLNRKISLLTKKLEKTEEELNGYKQISKDFQKLEINRNKINNENIILREDNMKISNKFNDEKKKYNEEIKEYKNYIKKLESENYILNNQLNEKNDMLEKEQKLNSQYSKIDKIFNNAINEKKNSYELINEKYSYLIKEFDNYKIQNLKEKEELIEKNNNLKNEKLMLEKEYTEKINDLNEKIKNSIYISEEYEIIKEEKKYILNLLLRIAPNAKLIQEIIEINKEIIKLERQKISIYNNTNKNESKIKNILPKMEEQIKIFKNHLNSLEDELINIDFGSSRSNIDNSINSSFC